MNDTDKPPDRRFQKQERVRLRSEFDRIYAQRRSASNELLTVYVCENGLAWSRLGMSISRKVGGAVVRNLIRRRIREAFRKNKSALPTELDIVCVVKPGLPASEAQYAKSIERLTSTAQCRRPKPRPEDKL